MSNTIEYVWNPSAVDTSSVLMDDNKNSKKKPRYRYRCLFVVFILLLILAIVLSRIFAINTKQNSQSSVTNTSNTSISNGKHNISIKGLLTIDTAASANICNKNQTMEDCVLIYNAKIIMNALSLIPSSTSNTPSISNASPKSFVEIPHDSETLQIRRNQLSQIFDSPTLETIHLLSGIPYSSADKSISSNQEETRSQIDARSLNSRWTSPINYYIDKTTGLNSTMVANIHTAISNWQNNTCLIFNELSVITSRTNTSYVRFQRDDVYGCSSPVSYDKTEPTSVILISADCSVIVVSIMHEIGHTLGFIHTQSRIDRDSYVTIVTENINVNYAANFFIWQFGTISFSDVTFPYDFGSFMHYNTYGFTVNGLPTIVAHDSVYEKTMGQREKAAFYDYGEINRLYCTRTDCPQMFDNNGCQNNGYLDPNTCSRCICPEGFSGTYCDQRDSNSNCGNTITNPTPYSSTQITIQNPTPTSTTSAQQYCVYLIQSGSPGKIHLRLDSINTVAGTVCSLTSVLEVKYRSDLALTGARWCGTTITSAWSNVTAETNTMVVIFRANNYINAATGNPQASFRATVFFDAEPTPAVSQAPITTATTVSSSTPSTITTTTTVSSSTTSTTRTTTNLLTTTGTTLSTCPLSSFRCQLPSQPTCGGCLSLQPCITQGSQQCTAYTYQIQLTGCDTIVNGTSQCRYQFIQTPYITTCQRTILLCCPNYQLISIQTQYFCVYNPQATDLSTAWSLIL